MRTKNSTIIFVFFISIFVVSCVGMNHIRELPLQDVDPSKIADGTYTGSFKAYRWFYAVDVAIDSHRIASIQIQECAGKNTKSMQKVNQKLVNKVIDKQSVNIDAVSGASITSKSFQKAVESALLKGKQKSREGENN